MKQVLVFDLDDTLYPERDYVRSGFEAVGLFLKSSLGVEGFSALAYNQFLSGVRANTFNLALDTLSVKYDDALITEIVNIYRNHIPEIKLFDDAREVLPKLSKNYKLALITDGAFESQRKKISALDIEKYFDLIVVTDELGKNREFWKPNKKSFEMVSNFFLAPNSSCVYIGDNCEKDFLAPNALGWSSIKIVRDGAIHTRVHTDERAPKREIVSLLELEKIEL